MNKKSKIFSFFFGPIIGSIASVAAIASLNSCGPAKQIIDAPANEVIGASAGTVSFRILDDDNNVEIKDAKGVVSNELLNFNNGKFTYQGTQYVITDISAVFRNGNNIIKGQLEIPSTVKRIGDYAFDDCSEITEIKFAQNGLLSIGSHSFADTIGATNSITLPESLIEINSRAFDGSSISGEIKIGDNVNNVGNYAFNDCSNITKISFGNKIEIINEGVCSKMNKLQEVNFTNNLTKIEDKAFYNCGELTTFINLDSTKQQKLRKIGQKAFSFCQKLSSFTFVFTDDKSEDIGYIGSEAFKDCTALSYDATHPLELSSSTTIDTSAFEGCQLVKAFYINKKTQNTYLAYKQNMFDSNYVTKIYVSSQEDLTKYSQMDDWEASGLLTKMEVKA